MANSSNYKQAAAIPFRRRGSELEICLVTTSSTGRWTFPKGIIDPGDTPEETALKESHEEAGLRGRIFGQPIGDYEYRKWGSTLTVRVYLMEVTHAEDEWEEMSIRKRKWVSPTKAIKLMSRHPGRRLLASAVVQLQASDK